MTTIFNEGFETGDLSQWDNVGGTSPSYASIVTTSPHAGVYCAECHDEAGSVYVMKKLTASPYPTEHWFRVYFDLVLAEGDTDERFWLVQAKNEANSSGIGVYGEMLASGAIRFVAVYCDDDHLAWANRVTFTPDDDVLIDTGAWHCLEGHLKLDDGDGVVLFLLDGVPIVELTGLDNDQVGDLNRFTIAAATGGTQTVRYDDIVVATERVTPLRGYHIYHNAGEGLIGYDTPQATLSEYAETWTSGALDYPKTWRFGLRTYNEYGEEKNVNVTDTLALAASGEESPARPNRPAGLGATAVSDAKVEITWSYDASGEPAACSHFHVYHDAGTGEVDYTTVIDSVDLDTGGGILTHYLFETDALDDGTTYRFAVRAATSDDVEDTGAEWVEAAADASAPTQPASLSGEVVR